MMMMMDDTGGGSMTHQAGSARPSRRPSGLMKYGSAEFKGSSAGAGKCDGDVPQSLMRLEPSLLLSSSFDEQPAGGSPGSGAVK